MTNEAKKLTRKEFEKLVIEMRGCSQGSVCIYLSGDLAHTSKSNDIIIPHCEHKHEEQDCPVCTFVYEIKAWSVFEHNCFYEFENDDGEEKDGFVWNCSEKIWESIDDVEDAETESYVDLAYEEYERAYAEANRV